MSNLIKPTLKNRLLNALAALRGRSTRGFETSSDRHNLSVHVDLDMTQFEAEVDRLKGRVAEIAELASAATMPPPRLLIQADSPLTEERAAYIREAVWAATGAGKLLVLDSGLTVFQLVDGRWQSLDDPTVWAGVDPAEPGADHSVEINSGTITFGESPLKTAREAIGSGLAAEQYTADLFANAAPEDNSLRPRRIHVADDPRG